MPQDLLCSCRWEWSRDGRRCEVRMMTSDIRSNSRWKRIVRSSQKRWAVPAALIALLAGLSACGQFAVDPYAGPPTPLPSVSANPLNAALENEKSDRLAAEARAAAEALKRKQAPANGSAPAATGAATAPSAPAPVPRSTRFCANFPESCPRGVVDQPEGEQDTRQLTVPPAPAGPVPPVQAQASAPAAASAAPPAAAAAPQAEAGGGQSAGVAAKRAQVVAGVARVAKIARLLNEQIMIQRKMTLEWQTFRSSSYSGKKKGEVKWLDDLRASFKLPEDASVETVLSHVDIAPIALLAAVASLDPKWTSEENSELAKRIASYVEALNTSSEAPLAAARGVRRELRAEGKVIDSKALGVVIVTLFPKVSPEDFMKSVGEMQTIVQETLPNEIKDGFEAAPAVAEKTTEKKN